MKRCKTITGNIFSLAALAYLALIPAIHSLHLVTCPHEPSGCFHYQQNSSIRHLHPHAVATPSGYGEEDVFSGKHGCSLVAETGHEASTCPVCQSLFRLLHVWWLIRYHVNSGPGLNPVSSPCPACHANLDWILLSARLSRAPPISC